MTLFKEETMLVHPVVVPGSGTLSWTVLGDDDVPVVPVDRFLAYLTDIGRSPNTVKAYAHDLKDYWGWIGLRGLDWREARLEDVGEFVAWLQLPAAGRSGAVAVLPSAATAVTAATVNRKLAAVSAFYAHQARNGAAVGDLLAAWKTGGRGGWKPFLHHVSKGRQHRGRAISLKVPVKLPRILTVAETQAILDACTRLRDRFFFALMHESGCRAGEALGLRHEDIAAAEREISIVPRDNANGARAKSGGRTVPVGGELIRLYADYLHEEYGGIDSDYVFINIWAQPRGQAWSYPAAYDLVLRLRAKTGIDFDPHWFRHSAATRWQVSGVAPAASFSSSCERTLPAVQRAALGQARGHNGPHTMRDLGCHHLVASCRTMMQPVRLQRMPT
jgi:integrase/recombinase XerD